MKKAFFLINSLATGGAEKVLSVIINELIKQEYNVEVIFLEKNEFYKLPKKVKKIYLSDFTGKESGLKKLLYLPILAWKLRKYIKGNDISLVQSHLYRANYVNILTKIFGSKHKAQIVNAGVVSRYKDEGLLGKINLFLIKILYPKSDLIIWKSKGMQYDAEKLFNFNTKQIVINNPFDLKQIKSLADEKVRDFEFKENKIYIVSVGRLVELKRNKDLIKTVSLLSNNIEVIFLGDGEEKENLIKLAKKLGVNNRVHFLGQVKNPYKYIKKCHLFVHTSETEGFPNVIVEALACGIPVISSDCISGPREILYPSSDITKQLRKEDNFELGDYGILYPVGNTQALKNAIEYLLNNKDVYKKYKQKSIERAKDFSVERIIEEYKRVLLNE